MSVRIALLGILMVAASCTERAAVSHAQGLPIDKRYGPARLDSMFGLNDPYAAFERPKATVSVTPAIVRDRFQTDLEAMFAMDSFSKAQLDSCTEILVFNHKFQDGLESFLMHVSDIIAGDQYVLYLKRGNLVSTKPWRWYGPAADKDMAPKVPEQRQLAIETIGGANILVVTEWRHNGNVYSAWIRTLLNIGGDLGLNQNFRYESAADLPFENTRQAIVRTATYDAATDRYIIRTSVSSIAGDTPVGTATMVREGKRWRMLKKSVLNQKYEKMIWSANPEGEQAIWESIPGGTEF